MNVLNLNNNNIKSIESAAFSNLRTIQLFLSGNRISSVGDWFNDTIINVLDLSSNSIIFLESNAFQNVENLTTVHLNKNRITFIEAAVFRKQTRIDLSSNYLDNINFLGETKLEYLDISFNQISSLQLSEETYIEEIIIYPNPWNCQCLRKFWRLAWKRGTRYGYPSLPVLNSSVPVCIDRDVCDEQYIDAQLREQYYRHEIVKDVYTVKIKLVRW
ncbi:hypothetical protein Trydic_g14656 [Trypoxylus dichotomus]